MQFLTAHACSNVVLEVASRWDGPLPFIFLNCRSCFSLPVSEESLSSCPVALLFYCGNLDRIFVAAQHFFLRRRRRIYYIYIYKEERGTICAILECVHLNLASTKTVMLKRRAVPAYICGCVDVSAVHSLSKLAVRLHCRNRFSLRDGFPSKDEVRKFRGNESGVPGLCMNVALWKHWKPSNLESSFFKASKVPVFLRTLESIWISCFFFFSERKINMNQCNDSASTYFLIDLL